MSTDDLDTRIRALVRDAVSAAPAVPDLPTGAPEVEPRRDRRRAVWAGIGIAAAIVAVAVLVTTHDRDPRIVAGSTSSDTPTTAPAVHTPWPDGVAVLVASDRGIERISGEKGEAVVTRLFSAAPTSRAIELENGSIVYQRTGGDIDVLDASLVPGNQALVTGDGTGSTALEDADAPLGSLRLVYRGPATDVSSALSLGTWFQPDEPRYAALPGGFGVGYRRFSIVDDRSVVAATVDDTGQRGAFTVTPGEDGHVAPEYVSPYLVVGDGAGSVAALGADGRVVLSGARSGVIAALDDPATVTDLDLRGDWLVVRRVDGSSTLVHTTDGAQFDVPVASGVVMLARSAPPSTPPTSTTLLPTTSAEPFPNCLTVTATAVADVQLDSVLSSLDPIPEEPITVAGRPAILQTWGSGYGVVFRQPDSCTEYSMTTMTMSKGGLLAWLAGVSVTEQLPPDMPTVLLRSSFGLSIVGPSGTKAVARVPVDQALLLADGRVVYHSSELA
ncbi:MAG: hypothetical protein RJA49_2694, partial [Actinomycetota bacterium]